MYDGCGETKTCFGFPEGCVNTQSCRTMVATTVRGERYEFELKSGYSEHLKLLLLGDNFIEKTSNLNTPHTF